MRSFWRASRAVKLGTAATVMGGTCYYTFIYSRNTPQRPPPQTLEDSLVGQEAPSIFQWSSLPPFIERRYDPPYPENGPIWNAASTVVTGGVGLFAKFMLRYFQQTRVYNIDAFLKIVDEDNRDRALITVSNHESVWDDPFLWGVLPVRTLLDIHKMRWVLGAADICFTTIPKSLFFSLGQAIPTIRGCGIYQPAVNFAIHKANQNGWIHIFPEARVNQTASMIRFKWGVGRIIMEADRCPIVIPVWHNGMALVRPLQGPFARFHQPIMLAFGDPIDFTDILAAWKAGEISETEARIKITSTIFKSLEQLKEKTEAMKRDLESNVDDNEGELKDTVRP